MRFQLLHGVQIRFFQYFKYSKVSVQISVIRKQFAQIICYSTFQPSLFSYSDSKVRQLKIKMSDCFLPNNTPFILLECEEAFNQLSEKEKLYSHYLSRASWLGSLIISMQVCKLKKT
ncbi:hypothetical protein AVEN_17635-1 [Araneus ventricosus]|uniref:Uncharacterized protein n=1 Tax=Araneus ventricosus TaxID=182803 RepID=A0A4Y2LFZ0_ARAVE|nr:hypothetical protein AVEN_17635-1 [Araneus ventricosus]